MQLWSCPRNVSTALMYAFAQRADTEVLDEPLYADFLRRTGARRPDRTATLAAMDADGARVLRERLLPPPARPLRFVKHIANQWGPLPDDALPRLGRHVLFLRDPRRIVASYARVVERPTAEDVALPGMLAFRDRLRAAGCAPLVLDAEDLRAAPEATLRALCAALDIPFDPAMLHWPAGPRPEDGPWAPWWYGRLHRSTGFEPEGPLPALSGEHAALAEACRPAWEALRADRLQP